MNASYTLIRLTSPRMMNDEMIPYRMRFATRFEIRCTCSCGNPVKYQMVAAMKTARLPRSFFDWGEMIAANADNVAQYRAGKDKAFNALVGQVMKASKGTANPQQATDLLDQ